ncbi:MAG: Rieske 2Fe-2S domain-containing protein [Terriglobales bacterium]|jgi:toluene monooxygenase system ferredoxin subunit
MGFQRVAKTEDLWSGEMMGLEVNGERILLVNFDNRIYAYADICPHQMSRLSEGTLTDKILRCGRHHWEFDVCSGSGVNPQNACLKPFPIRVDGEDILVDIDGVRNLGTGVDEGKER